MPRTSTAEKSDAETTPRPGDDGGAAPEAQPEGADHEGPRQEAIAAALADEPAGVQEFQDDAGFVTDYDANGEAVDRPIENPRPQQKTDFLGVEVEMHEGRPVTDYELSVSGKITIAKGNPHASAWFDGLRAGKPERLVITADGGQDGHRPVAQDGAVVGLARFRKLKLTSVVFEHLSDATEGLPLFEHGEAYVEDTAHFHRLEDLQMAVGWYIDAKATHPDDEADVEHCYELVLKAMELLDEPPVEDTGSDFAPSPDGEESEPSPLNEALTEAGICGRVHAGHLNSCPVTAADCDLE